MPGGFIGLFGLADYAGPTGWRGVSEFLGWAVICSIAGFSIGFLLAQWRRRDTRGYFAVLFALVAAAVFTFLPYWLGLYAPMTAKVIFTTSLQIVGSVFTAGAICWIAYAMWSGRRGY
jgi:hypothetical protein